MIQLFFKNAKRMWDTLERYKFRAKDWFLARAHGSHAKTWLAVLSFSEASFFIIPPEVLYVPILLAGTTRWIYYAFITTIFSLAGGIFGYLIGAFLFDLIGEFIISTYGLEKQMLYVSDLFKENAFWTIFIAAFTPIPYKVFTLSSGFFLINFFVFIVASFLGRSLRYFFLGYLIKIYGGRIGHLIFKYFNGISIFFVVLLVLVLLIKAFHLI